MHEKLFDNAKQLGPQLLPGYAADLGFDVADFEACMASDRHLKHIASDSMEAQRRGITGTPSFVLGVTNGDTVEGAIIRGAVPLETFQSQIEALLAKGVNE